MAYEDYIPRGAGVPGAVSYVSPVSDAATSVFLNALNEKNKQFDAQLNAIAENQALLSQMKFRDPDKAGMLVRAAKVAGDLDRDVQEKFAGDYASLGARRAIASRIAQERGAFSQAQQAYEEEQPYKQLYMNLKASGQLAQKYNPLTKKVEEVNPFGQALYDAEGNRVLGTNLDYGDIRKRGDYDEYIRSNIVKALNETVRPTDQLPKTYRIKNIPFQYFTKSGKIIGYTPQEAVGKVTDSMVDTFMANNPTFAFEFGDNKEAAKQYIQKVVAQNARQQTDLNFGNLTDAWGMRQAAQKAATSSELRSPFMTAQKESAQDNPFLAKGIPLSQAQSLVANYKFKTPAEAESGLNKMIANNKKQIQRMYESNKNETAQLYEASNRKLQKDLETIKGYSQELYGRKTNWFNEAAKSITGDKTQSYKTLPEELKREIRNKMPKSDTQWAQLFDADTEGKYLTFRNTLPVADDAQKAMANAMGNFDGAYFRMAGSKSASKNVYDVAKEANIDPQTIIVGLKTNQLKAKFIPSTGEYQVVIPSGVKLSKEGKLDYNKAKSEEPKYIYFSPDNTTRTYTDIQTWAEGTRYSTKRDKKSFNTPMGTISIEKIPGNDNFKVTHGGSTEYITKQALDDIITQSNIQHINNSYIPYSTNNIKQYNQVMDLAE